MYLLNHYLYTKQASCVYLMKQSQTKIIPYSGYTSGVNHIK